MNSKVPRPNLVIGTGKCDTRSTLKPASYPAAWTLVHEASCQPIFGQFGGLSGPQTVPRAELWAAICANRIVSQSDSAEQWTYCDSSYTVKGINNESQEGLLKGSNGDLWKIQSDEWRPNHRIAKIKAHAEEQVMEGVMDAESYLLNAVADASADACADALVSGIAWQWAENCLEIQAQPL